VRAFIGYPLTLKHRQKMANSLMMLVTSKKRTVVATKDGCHYPLGAVLADLFNTNRVIVAALN
jgi:hypothetical protein